MSRIKEVMMKVSNHKDTILHIGVPTYVSLKLATLRSQDGHTDFL